MGLSTLLGGPWTRRLGALTMVADAGRSLRRGNRGIAAVLLAAAFLTYRFSALGWATQLLVALYRRRR